MFRRVVPFASLLLLASPALADRLELIDGAVMEGAVHSQDASVVRFLMGSEVKEVPRAQIRSLAPTPAEMVAQGLERFKAEGGREEGIDLVKRSGPEGAALLVKELPAAEPPLLFDLAVALSRLTVHNRLTGDEAIPDLLARLRELKGRDPPVELSAEVLFAVGKVDRPDVCAFLIERAEDSEPAEGKNAIQALQGQSGKAPMEFLIRKLGDPSRNTRRRSLVSLLEIAGRANPADLMDLLAVAYPSSPKAAQPLILRAMAYSKDPRAVSHLVPHLTEGEIDVRRAAVFGLLLLADRSSSEAIVRAYRTETEKIVRKEMLEALGALKNEDAVPALIPVLGDPDAEIKEAALSALRQITGQGFGNNTLRWRRWVEGREARAAAQPPPLEAPPPGAPEEGGSVQN